MSQNSITYFLSIDNGANWVEISALDEVTEFSVDGGGNIILGNDVANWNP